MRKPPRKRWRVVIALASAGLLSGCYYYPYAYYPWGYPYPGPYAWGYPYPPPPPQPAPAGTPPTPLAPTQHAAPPPASDGGNRSVGIPPFPPFLRYPFARCFACLPPALRNSISSIAPS